MNVPKPNNILFEGIDFNTEEGAKIKRYLEARLALLREMNDSLEHDIAQTAAIRGKIEVIKSLLKGPAPKPQTFGGSKQ